MISQHRALVRCGLQIHRLLPIARYVCFPRDACAAQACAGVSGKLPLHRGADAILAQGPLPALSEPVRHVTDTQGNFVRSALAPQGRLSLARISTDRRTVTPLLLRVPRGLRQFPRRVRIHSEVLEQELTRYALPLPCLYSFWYVICPHTDNAANLYYNRDFRRKFPQTDYVSQQYLTELLLAEPNEDGTKRYVCLPTNLVSPKMEMWGPRPSPVPQT